jgi:hypothetical protein
MTAIITGTIPWPQYQTTLTRWADELYLARPDFDVLPRMTDETKWREWGNQVVQSTVLQSAGTPRTDGFKDWRAWATELIKSLGTAS